MIHSARRWVCNSLGLFLIALLFVIGSFSLDCGLVRLLGAQRTSAQSKRKSFSASNASVAELFRNNCARCHGADGRSDTPLGHTYQAPDFTDGEWWRKHSHITSTRSLIAIVNHGKGGMPAFRKKLRPREITALVNYVRRFRPSR